MAVVQNANGYDAYLLYKCYVKNRRNLKPIIDVTKSMYMRVGKGLNN